MAVSFYTVAAICGNFYGESGVNPARPESGHEQEILANLTDISVYGGYGLGQWTNGGSVVPGLRRRTDLIEWLRSHGYADDSGDGQCAYMGVEKYWRRNPLIYNSYDEFMENTETSTSHLTALWWYNWEGITPSQASQQQRLDFADDIFPYLVDHYDDPDITTWATGTYGITYQQAKDNSVLVARCLIGGAPPPPHPTERQKPPLFFYCIRKFRQKKGLLV